MVASEEEARASGGSKRGSILFRQDVKGGVTSNLPTAGVLADDKKGEGRYGGRIGPAVHMFFPFRQIAFFMQISSLGMVGESRVRCHGSSVKCQVSSAKCQVPSAKFRGSGS